MPRHPAVLIVDDDDIFVSVTESMIKMIGLPVMKAHDGLEALSIFQKHSDAIGCVMLDIQMPRMNGITAFQHLKKLRGNVQVIIASGYLDDTNRKKLAPLHPAGYLKKPISYHDLSDLLTKCMQQAAQCEQDQKDK